MNLNKLILIRYNMAAPYASRAAWYDGHRPHLNPDWLSGRKALFDRYCWPSIDRQTDPDFDVLVLFDQETPPDYVAAITDRDPRLHVGFTTRRSGRNGNPFSAAISAAVKDYLVKRSIDEGFLWTTRLDSDDALGPNYMTRLSAEVARRDALPDLSYYYFPRGQVYDAAQARYYNYLYPRNAFGTLIERIDLNALKTAYFKTHTDLLRLPDATSVGGGGQWCMVIHDRNVLNTVRGVPLETPFFPV